MDLCRFCTDFSFKLWNIFFFCLCSEECKKDVPVVLIDMHSCSLEAKIKLNLGAFLLLTLSVYDSEFPREIG